MNTSTNNLTPETALSNLVTAARQLPLTYEQHLLLEKSAEVLRAVIAPPPAT